MEFQSHAGSIEANLSRSDTDREWLGFNPTLVRLRRFPLMEAHNVSLWFQSHAGSIEAREVGPEGEGEEGFNPTLVRLRRSGIQGHEVPGAGFNPTLVRLRRGEHGSASLAMGRFNPTLVRLRR